MTFDEAITNHNDQFQDNDRYIIAFILQHRATCHQWTIQDFATRCLVSKSSVVRFCQKIGLTGFAQLKAMLKWEQQTSQQDECLSTIVKESYQKMIHNLTELDLTKIFDEIQKAERIIIFGSGVQQARVASECKRIFLPIGKTIIHVSDMALLEALKSIAKEDDLIIFISLSGEKQQLIQLAKYLQLKHVPTISITRLKSNPLAMECRYALYMHSIQIEKKDHTSYEIVTPYYMLIEILYIMYQQYRYVHNSIL